MDKFEFHSPARIVFGRGQFDRIGQLASQLGSAALVIHNAPESGDGGLPDRLAALLSDANLPCAFLRQRGEPQVADVDRALLIARQHNCDLVIALGGGSAIDAAKAVAGLLTNPGSALDYMEVVGAGLKITRPSAPWIAVPTTAGTGAEVTRNAVIGCPEKRFKASIRSQHLLPRIALVDPELGVPVRPEITARSGMDALCQLIESCTSLAAQPMTDALAMKGIALAARSLRRAYENGADLDAREDMAMAALLSGITLSNAGLGAVHGFAAPLGANFPAPHGVICAALLPHVIAANTKALRAQSPDHPFLARYAAIGRTLAFRPDLPDLAAVEACIEVTRRLVRDLAIPPLARFGLAERDIPQLVSLARKSSSMRYNPLTLPDDVLAEVLRRAINAEAAPE
jgi:alcohol dehydrogenase class IV